MVVAFTLMLLAAAPTPAKPFVEPGVVPEAQGQPIRPGDRWIRMRIDIDAKGRPTRCGVIEGNVRDSEMRFWMCNAMMQDWHTQPVAADGQPAPKWVVRTMIIPGKESERAIDAAKARH